MKLNLWGEKKIKGRYESRSEYCSLSSESVLLFGSERERPRFGVIKTVWIIRSPPRWGIECDGGDSWYQTINDLLGKWTHSVIWDYDHKMVHLNINSTETSVRKS